MNGPGSEVSASMRRHWVMKTSSCPVWSARPAGSGATILSRARGQPRRAATAHNSGLTARRRCPGRSRRRPPQGTLRRRAHPRWPRWRCRRPRAAETHQRVDPDWRDGILVGTPARRLVPGPVHPLVELFARRGEHDLPVRDATRQNSGSSRLRPCTSISSRRPDPTNGCRSASGYGTSYSSRSRSMKSRSSFSGTSWSRR
jgi:hypothetical protein